jgi:hypothetical protein
VEFRDRSTSSGSASSLKALHRLMVTSATYRQAVTADAKGLSVDAGNRYLWRMNRRRLDAESIRDSVLLVSGKLDRRMYGEAFRDFVLEHPEHSPHYEYGKHDPDDPATHRRSIYRFLVRSQQQPFMETLDCADPSMIVAKRDETLTALQALTLLNNRFMLRMAEHFADRLRREAPTLPEQLALGYRLAISRDPTEDEARMLLNYAQQHGLANACRVILNLNEFVFVD